MMGFAIPMPEGSNPRGKAIGRGANRAVARLRRSWPTRGGAVWESASDAKQGPPGIDARLVCRRGVGASCRDHEEVRPWRSNALHSAPSRLTERPYEHDVIIRLSGEVAMRKKKLSKKYYGTSHVLSKDEAKFVFENGCEQLILGSGQMGNVHLSPEAEAYFAKKGCAVLLQPTPKAIHTFNSSHAKKIGLFHVTC